MGVELQKIDTEQRNPRTMHIDTLSTLEMVRLINSEDQLVAQAVAQVVPEIAQAVDIIYGQLRQGGRLVYCGAGTSGRLGVLDAVECPPTYGVSPELVVGLIAGGDSAFVRAVEGAEDNRQLGREDLVRLNFSPRDVLVGIAASGRTPYVLGAMDYAREVGAPVLALTCCHDSELSRHADVTMAPIPGPEVVTGSSRMKSGTAQKMVLNILSTVTMIKLGKVYGNLMVDVKASNEKLYQRAVSIVRSATGAEEADARAALERCGYACKPAILSILLGWTPEQAAQALERADGRIAQALEQARAEGAAP